MPKKGDFKNRTGEKYITNEGYEIEIIECFGKDDCTIRFSDGNIYKNIFFVAIKSGRIKNPYHPSVCGIGYIGVGKYLVSVNSVTTKEYDSWQRMFQRCYGNRLDLPTYKNVTVCEEWCNFQNFAKWFEENWKPWMDSKWNLDKDILVKGNKIYSSETCCFVPQEINKLFVISNSKRGVFPIGVVKQGNKFTSQCRNFFKSGRYIALHPTVEEAFQAYKTAKEYCIKEMAELWRDKIPKRVYETMINYNVEITD